MRFRLSSVASLRTMSQIFLGNGPDFDFVFILVFASIQLILDSPRNSSKPWASRSVILILKPETWGDFTLAHPETLHEIVADKPHPHTERCGTSPSNAELCEIWLQLNLSSNRTGNPKTLL